MDPVVQLLLVIALCSAVPAFWILFLLLSRDDDEIPAVPSTPFDPQALARQLGVEVSYSNAVHRLGGDREGRRWSIALSRIEGVWTSQVEVACAVPPGVRVRPEGFFGGKDPDLGDPAFDSLVDLQGDASWLSAVFSARARADLLELQGRGGYRLDKERVTAQAHVGADGADILRALEVSLRLAAALDLDASELPGALLRRSRETSGDVGRLAAFRLLAAFPSSPEARQLVESGGRLDSDPAFVALSMAVEAPERAEPRILNLLGHRELEIRRAAVRWLHDHGTADAVLALRDASTAQLKEPVRDAVRAIQGRVVQVEAGGLALVADDKDAGRLALAEDEAGRLALARARRESGKQGQ